MTTEEFIKKMRALGIIVNTLKAGKMEIVQYGTNHRGEGVQYVIGTLCNNEARTLYMICSKENRQFFDIAYEYDITPVGERG